MSLDGVGRVSSNPVVPRILGTTPVREIGGDGVDTLEPTLIGAPDPLALASVSRIPVLRQINGDVSPLRRVFSEPLDLTRLKEKLTEKTLEHKEFFTKLSEASKLSSKDDVLVALRKLEDETFEKLTPQMINKLFNTYKAISKRDAKRFFERLREADFEIDPSMHADYVLILNRLGMPNRAIAEAEGYFQRTHMACNLVDSKIVVNPRMEIPAEFILGIGTAWKNKFLLADELLRELKKTEPDQVKLQELKEKYKGYFQTDKTDDLNLIEKNRNLALEKSHDFYDQSFTLSLSYYPGVNVVRSFIYKGDYDKAKEMARIVDETVLHADVQKSFWPLITQLELSLVTGNEKQRQKVLPYVLGMIKEQDSSDVNTVLAHLKLWSQLKLERLEECNPALDETIVLLQRAINGENFPMPNGNALPGEKYLTVRDALEASTYVVGRARKGIQTPYNDKYGGIVVAANANLQDRFLRNKVLTHKDNEQSESLLDVTDIWDLNSMIDSFLEKTFRLRNAEGKRDVENMLCPRHIELEAFWRGILDISGNKDYKMAATSIMTTLVIGEGDCRHVNKTKQYLFNGKIRADRERIILEEYNKLKSGAADFGIGLDTLVKGKRKVSLMDAKIYGSIQMDGPYKIRRDAEGRGFLSDKEEHIDSHTFPILEEYDEDANVKRLTIIDAWYGGEELFKLSHVVIEGEDLEHFRKTGELLIKNGAEVLENGQMKKVSLRIVPERHSKPRQFAPQRYGALDQLLASHLIDAPSEDLYFDVDKRQQFYNKFILPVIVRGLEVMIEENGADKDRAEQYLRHLSNTMLAF